MRLFVTAGNTLVLIDRVRAITNIFSGRTVGDLALEAHRRGHRDAGDVAPEVAAYASVIANAGSAYRIAPSMTCTR